MLVAINDIFAYIIGKNFGKRKLIQRLSPNKTVEGFVGAAITTIIAGYFVILTFFSKIFSVTKTLKNCHNSKYSPSHDFSHNQLLEVFDREIFPPKSYKENLVNLSIDLIRRVEDARRFFFTRHGQSST